LCFIISCSFQRNQDLPFADHLPCALGSAHASNNRHDDVFLRCRRSIERAQMWCDKTVQLKSEQ
jgi:hypothetical protein